jgi:hypothetical protein
MAKHGWRYDRAIHNYIYFVFYYPYVAFVYYLYIICLNIFQNIYHGSNHLIQS